MKKKILFIASNLNTGGVQKSLISLLNCFDFDKYDVDLYLLSREGVLQDFVPKNVNFIELNFDPSFFKKFPYCIKELCKNKSFYLIYKRLVHVLISRIDKGYGAIYMSKLIPKIDKKYDAIIDYGGQQLCYYMVDILEANKKITFFHSNYKNWGYYFNADKRYYDKVDYIFTISETCKNSLMNYFPQQKDKIMYNIVSEKIIKKMSKDTDFNKMFELNENIIKILTLGRPTLEKGYDYCIKVCKMLKDEGYDLKWYSIGMSNEIEKFKQMAKEYSVEDIFIFLGETSNPYKYIDKIDICVHPSRFEGKAIAVDEMKILCKPILITNFDTVYDQIENGTEGIIVNMDEESIFNGLKELIESNDLRNKLIKNLESRDFSNEYEILKLYKAIES